MYSIKPVYVLNKSTTMCSENNYESSYDPLHWCISGPVSPFAVKTVIKTVITDYRY